MRKLNIYSNRNNNPFENTGNTFGQSQTEQSYGLGNNNQNQSLFWPQSYGLETENQNQIKPVYETPNPRRFSTGEILWDGVKGFGQGMIGGIEHGINTMSLGLYDVINDAFFDAGYEKRQKELENLAEDVNLNKAYKYANYIIDAAVGTLPFNKMTKKISPVVSRIYRKIK